MCSISVFAVLPAARGLVLSLCIFVILVMQLSFMQSVGLVCTIQSQTVKQYCCLVSDQTLCEVTGQSHRGQFVFYLDYRWFTLSFT